MDEQKVPGYKIFLKEIYPYLNKLFGVEPEVPSITAIPGKGFCYDEERKIINIDPSRIQQIKERMRKDFGYHIKEDLLEALLISAEMVHHYILCLYPPLGRSSITRLSLCLRIAYAARQQLLEAFIMELVARKLGIYDGVFEMINVDTFRLLELEPESAMDIVDKIAAIWRVNWKAEIYAIELDGKIRYFGRLLPISEEEVKGLIYTFLLIPPEDYKLMMKVIKLYEDQLARFFGPNKP